MNRSGKVINSHVLAVVENEWAQMRRNRVILFTTFAPPFLFIALALAVLILTSIIDLNLEVYSKLESTLVQHVDPVALGLANADVLQASLLNPFLLLFEMLPIVVPLTVASYSIIGEKQTRSLEALLATPIKTWELMLAKMMAAVIPGIAATWCSFAVFVLVARFTVSPRVYTNLILSPTWLVTITLLTPVLTMFAVTVGIIISSKVKDPQSAQQLGSLIVLPVVALLLAQISGAVRVNLTGVVGAAVGLAILDVGLMGVAVRLFQREAILTRWR